MGEKLIETEPDAYLTQEEKDKKINKLRSAWKVKKEEKELANLSKALDEINAKNNYKKEKETKINKVDPESPVMTHKDRTRPTGGSSPLGKKPSYNHQSSIDAKCSESEKYQITTAVQTTVKPDSGDDLIAIVEKSKENTQEQHQYISSDSGFCSYKTLEEVINNREEIFLLPDNRFEVTQKGDSAKGKFDASNFEKNEDGTLTCPNGETLQPSRIEENKNENHIITTYKGENCINCEDHDKCTKNTPDRREQSFRENRTVTIDGRMIYRDKMRERLQSREGNYIYRKRKWIALLCSTSLRG